MEEIEDEGKKRSQSEACGVLEAIRAVCPDGNAESLWDLSMTIL
jgi:hypothetical protein